MKILVIFTGGTIGSVVEDGYISPDEDKKYKLMEWYQSKFVDDTIFEARIPYTLLSEDLTGSEMEKLGVCVRESLTCDYDGIIVAHGTDTLQYSAAMVSYLTGTNSIPVVFVSSNYVLQDIRANGYDNFCCAVEFIKKRRGTGTFIAYRNRDNIIYMHRATKVLPHLPFSDEVFSINDAYYARYFKNNERREENLIEKRYCYEENVQYQLAEKHPSVFKEIKFAEASNILRIFPYPGMQYPEILPNVRAVLLDTYHSGTMCSKTKNIEHLFCEVEKRQIPVYIVGVNLEIDYESFQYFEKKRVGILRNISPVAAYVKLWMALEQDLELDEIMRNCTAEDM